MICFQIVSKNVNNPRTYFYIVVKVNNVPVPLRA
jgi:hypothetical protein